jgi:hypothetical protein
MTSGRGIGCIWADSYSNTAASLSALRLAMVARDRRSAQRASMGAAV